MIVRFTPPELRWLNAVLNKVYDYKLMTGRNLRTIAKMKTCFTENATVSYLRGKDRQMLLSIINIRRNIIGTKISGERELLDNIERKIVNDIN